MTRYAKLIDGQPQFASNPLRMPDGGWRCNPPDEVYRELGYKPVVEEERPSAPSPPGRRIVEHWEETEDHILRSWELAQIPDDGELSAEEALGILTGGEGA